MSKITKKSIRAEIALFTTSRDALRNHAQEIAKTIVRYAAPAILPECQGVGDCTLAIELVRAMPGSWGTQMIAWFAKFTPIRVSEKSGKCEYDAKYKSLVLETMTAEEKVSGNIEKLTWWDIESINTISFWNVTEEKRAQDEYDWKKLLALVSRLSTTIDKKLADGKIKPEDVESAKAMSVKLAGLTFERVEAKTMIETPSNDAEPSKDAEGLSGITPALAAVA